MRTIGVMAEFITGVYLGELVGALHQELRARGLRMLAVRIGSLRGSYGHDLATHQADAWVVILNAVDPALLERIVATGRPVCCIGYQYANPAIGYVRCDNRAGTLQALQALRAAGHTEYAYVGYSQESDIAERESALREFLLIHGFDTRPERFELSDDYSYLGGHAATARLLARGVAFTALFVGNDQNALGAIACLREHSIRVPEDVAVVGFDNSPLARSRYNHIASVDQGLSAMARCAVDDLLTRIANPHTPPVRRRLAPRFVPRLSAGLLEQLGGGGEAAPISRDVALSSIANSDEMNRFLHAGGADNVNALLARLVPRLRFALVAQWEMRTPDVLKIGFAAPQGVALALNHCASQAVRDFPPLEPGALGPSAAGELVVVMSTDARGGERSVIAISAAADSFDDFELVLLIHELELIAIGIERMSAHQQLEREVASRTHELRSLNHELAHTLESLHRTQRDLLRAEKLASLGRLVAGVAHELNTPLGNCVISVSTMEEELSQLRAQLQAGSLRRSSLEALLDVLERGTALLNRNLQSATGLVADFRKISADQASASRARFELLSLMQDVTEVLRNRYRDSAVRIELSSGLAAPVYMESYQHQLVQVLLELAENAVLHGLQERAGTVSLRLQEAAEEVRLSVEDTGVGVPVADLERIFDPFFTTRMGRASGLGLSVVHNVVTGLLGGEVHAEPRPGGGTVIQLCLPRQAPEESKPRP